jgi:hypothetical protein
MGRKLVNKELKKLENDETHSNTKGAKHKTKEETKM